jgi:hypothetical protein
MMTADAILEPLDRKLGRPVTMQDWIAVGQKHVSAITDDDLLVIEAFQGRAARSEKEAARARWLTPAPAVAAPVKTNAAETAVTAAELRKQFKAYTSATVALVKDVLAERDQKIATLEAEVTTLKADHVSLAEKALKGGDVWQAQKAYTLGDVVSHSGSWWRCTTAHVAAGPYFDHGFWRLAVQKGRDGRDLR